MKLKWTVDIFKIDRENTSVKYNTKNNGLNILVTYDCSNGEYGWRWIETRFNHIIGLPYHQRLGKIFKTPEEAILDYEDRIKVDS